MGFPYLAAIVNVKGKSEVKLWKKKESGFGCFTALWFFVTTISFWIGIAVIKSNGYKDGSPETGRTILISLALPTALFLLIITVKWIVDRVQLARSNKLRNYLEEIHELKLKIAHKDSILHFIELLKYCGCETGYFENNQEINDIRNIEIKIAKKENILAKFSDKKH